MNDDVQGGDVESNDGGPFHSEMIIIRDGDPDGEEKLRAYHERMRARIGDEAFEHHMRTRELMKHPRELTAVQKAMLREAVAPLMRDLQAAGQAPPLICEESREDLGDDAICAWIEAPDGTGQGLRVWLNGSAGYQLYSLAEQVQEWTADQWATWPPCPVHLDSQHRLEPDIRDDEAVWCCPRDGQTMAAVGFLPARPGRRRKDREADATSFGPFWPHMGRPRRDGA
jgi:hypothetical protein